MPRKPNAGGDHYNDPFPSRLRKLMESRNVKQEELTSVLGVKSRQSITGYIDGETVPTGDKIVALAKYFGVSADYLLGLANSPTTNAEEKAVLNYTGLSHEVLRSIIQAKNNDYLDFIEIFIKNSSLKKNGLRMKRLLEDAISKLELIEHEDLEFHRETMIEDLSAMEDTIDLYLYRIQQCTEQAMLEHFPIQRIKDNIKYYRSCYLE